MNLKTKGLSKGKITNPFGSQPLVSFSPPQNSVKYLQVDMSCAQGNNIYQGYINKAPTQKTHTQ